MASYLRPRRGKKIAAETLDIVLRRGEVFFEIGNNGNPTTGTDAKSFGKIKMGDGTTEYSNLGYFIDVDTTAVDWTDTTTTATSRDQGADNYATLNEIVPSATMKSILASIKSLLFGLSTKVTTIQNTMVNVLEVTENEYEALTEEELTDGAIRIVGNEDEDNGMHAALIVYDNSFSGLRSRNLQTAIDELEMRCNANDTLDEDVVADTSVGAIPAGTTIRQGTTFTEFVQKLLMAELPPVAILGLSKGGGATHGDSYTETLTVTVSDMGTAKSIARISWYAGETFLATTTVDSATTGTWSYTMETATTTDTIFKANIAYVQSDDNEGVLTETDSITFYYDKFHGTVDDLVPEESTVTALTANVGANRGATFTFDLSNERVCYAYPKILGQLTDIHDNNGLSLINSFTKTEVEYTQNETEVSYYRYVLTDPTTISGYTITFE